MSINAKKSLQQIFLTQLAEIDEKEKKFHESKEANADMSDSKFTSLFVSHFGYLESRLSRSLEVTIAILKYDKKDASEFEELKIELNKVFKELRNALLNNYPKSMLGKYASDFIMVRNEIINKSSIRILCENLFLEEKNVLESLEPLTDFLGIDMNWMVSVIALQLQEIAVEKLSTKSGLELKRENIEKILDKKIELNQIKFMPFNLKYDAFSKFIKNEQNVDMPKMIRDLRSTRTNVLHLGYNPTPEETKTIITFTEGFLEKLKSLS